MEAFENLKRRLLLEVSNREEIPADVTKMIKEAVIKLEQLYQRNGTINGSIEQYMEGTIQEVNAHLKNRYGEDRRTMHFTDAQQILNDIEKGVYTRNNIEYAEIGSSEQQRDMADKTCELLREGLMDIRSRQNSILDARGFSQGRIEQINAEAVQFIREYISTHQEEVVQMYRDDDKQLKQDLVSQFEMYLQDKQTEEKRENDKNEQETGEAKMSESKEQDFRDSMSAGISLEEQKRNADEFAIQQEENKDKEPKQTSVLRDDYIM